MEALLIAGTRPEVIKLQPVYDALVAQGDIPTWAIVEQSPDLLAAHVHKDSKMIRVDLTLPTPRGDVQKLACLHAEIMRALEHRIHLGFYDVVVVQGDTQTACAGAMFAALQKVPVAHVEAGLRTHTTNPWPEEMNRRVIAQVASLHLTPSGVAAFNLQNEGIAHDAIVITGQTGIDTLHAALARVGPPLDRGQASIVRPRILVTCHRRENRKRIPLLITALRPLLETHFVCWPRHPNYASDVRDAFPYVNPLSHDDLVAQLQVTDLVITDSGGIIEEAAELEKPCLIIRDETERPEAIDNGCRLVRHDEMNLVLQQLVIRTLEWSGKRQSKGVFGDGHAGERIAKALQQFAEKS